MKVFKAENIAYLCHDISFGPRPDESAFPNKELRTYFRSFFASSVKIQLHLPTENPPGNVCW